MPSILRLFEQLPPFHELVAVDEAVEIGDLLQAGVATFYTVNGLKKPRLITTPMNKIIDVEARQNPVGPPPPGPPPLFEFTSDLSPAEIDRRITRRSSGGRHPGKCRWMHLSTMGTNSLSARSRWMPLSVPSVSARRCTAATSASVGPGRGGLNSSLPV
jgi:hypothetical protein